MYQFSELEKYNAPGSPVRNWLEESVILNIKNNPLACNSTLCWLLNPSCAMKIRVSGLPCHTPESLRMVSWRDITKDHLQCSK